MGAASPRLGAVIDESDLTFLRRAIAQARLALEAGDAPFGSVLVSGEGEVLAEDRNRETTAGDATRHPEFDLARWAAGHLTPEERGEATVYTSGEHCPMCSAAHAWVGLGRVVYAYSAEQLVALRAELGAPSSPVAALPIQQVAPGLQVDGPAPELEAEMLEIHRERWRREQRP